MSRHPDSHPPESPALSIDSDTCGLLGVVDFSYQHYALGDLLTLQIEFAIIALERKLRHVDVVAFVDPEFPSAPFQSFVTSDSYVTHFDSALPLFACNPTLRSLQLIRDRGTFDHLVRSHHRRGGPMWPPYNAHLRMRQEYPIGYLRAKAFHARHGYLPQLCAPISYEPWARRFHARELRGQTIVVINPRQSSLTYNPAALYRDAPLAEWHAFLDESAVRRPDVLFVMVGGYQEWEHSLRLRKNVVIPRAFGLGLAHELALLKIADLFLGSSSGFAAFATFIDIPYAILNVEHRFAPHGGIMPGERGYPFAGARQVLTWERETTEQLSALLAELLHEPEPNDGSRFGVRPADPGKMLR